MQRLAFLIVVILLLSTKTNAEEKQPAPLSPEQQLVYAAFDLDVERVKELIARPVDVNARMGNHPKHLFKDKWSLGWPVSSRKWTPLLAVAHSHREPPPKNEVKNTSEALKQAQEDRSKIDPKLIAERGSHRVAIAKLLIEAKAKLDLDDGYGNTALAQAVDNDYEELALLLINAGAQVNTQTGIYIDGPGGVTPLHDATGNPRLVEALLKHGADAKACDTSGMTPLHRAALGAGSAGLREIGARGAKKPLLKAPAGPSKAAQCVKLLIEAGADVNANDKEGRTPLYWVMTDGTFHFPGDEEKKEVADLLRKAGAK